MSVENVFDLLSGYSARQKQQPMNKPSEREQKYVMGLSFNDNKNGFVWIVADSTEGW
jgi:hypothetical protein